MAKVTINVDFAWEDGQAYYVTADQGFVVDADTGTPSPAITSTTEITFTTLDKPVVDFDNINDSGDATMKFKFPALLTVDFAQPVTPVATKTVVVKQGVTTVGTYNLTDFEYDDETYTFTYRPGLFLDPELSYTATAEAGAAIDEQGFASAETEGTVTETAIRSSLGNGSISIDYGQAITINTGDIRLYKTVGAELIETIDVTSNRVQTNGNTLEISPNYFLYNDNESFYILTDANIVLDATGFGAPAIVTAGSPEFPVDFEYAMMSGTIVLKFDRPVYAGTGNITIHLASNDNIERQYDVTSADIEFADNLCVINTELVQNVEYYLNIASTAIVDIDQIEFLGETGAIAFDFTVDNGPTISTRSPADGATDVNSNDFYIDFSEDVTTTGAGRIEVRKTSDDSLVSTASSDNFTFSASRMDFEFSDMLEPSTGYYLLHTTGTAKDGLNFANLETITLSTAWNFTSGEGINWRDTDFSSVSPAFGEVLNYSGHPGNFVDSNLNHYFMFSHNPAFDRSQLAKVDKDLNFVWSISEQAGNSFNTPCGDSSAVFASVNSSIVKFDTDANVLWQKVPSTANALYTIAVDSAGDVWATPTTGTNTLIKLDGDDGSILLSKSFSTLSSGGNLCIDGSDNVYLSADTGSAIEIHKFNSSGVFQFSKSIPYTDTLNGYLLTADDSDNFYVFLDTQIVTNSILYKLSSTGTVTWQKTGICGANSTAIQNLYVDVYDNIYVLGRNSVNTTSAIIRLNSDGTLNWANTLNNRAEYLTVTPYLNIIVFGEDYYNVLLSDGSDTGTYGSQVYASSSLTITNASTTVSAASDDSSAASHTVSTGSVVFVSDTNTPTIS